ncbi:redoxin domain-containing protein [Salarchaeum sp. III]|uniref:redoxin domain-containing protein n=1 Tax=Salarchaeum sp. III TaxID=3107927 RepID=UPI002EDA64D4
MTLEPGDRPRNCEGLLCDGEVFTATSIEEVSEGGVLFVFYGFAFSAIAENWWRQYDRRGWDDFDVPVVGVGRDGPNAQNAFLRSLDSPFRIYADVDGRLAEEFGVLARRENMAGVRIPKRSAFLLDADRAVEAAWVLDDWTTPMPASDIEEAIR